MFQFRLFDHTMLGRLMISFETPEGGQYMFEARLLLGEGWKGVRKNPYFSAPDAPDHLAQEQRDYIVDSIVAADDSVLSPSMIALRDALVAEMITIHEMVEIKIISETVVEVDFIITYDDVEEID